LSCGGHLLKSLFRIWLGAAPTLNGASYSYSVLLFSRKPANSQMEPVLQPRNYLSKEDFILAAARGRTVLHLGCVGFSDLILEERARLVKQSLHWKLSQVADVVGVDYSAQVIDEYSRLGIFTNIVPGDVQELTKLPLRGPFDVIIAGDIIEHLSNPGMMLDGIRPFCSADTRFIITTPNAFGLPNYCRFLLGKFKEGKEHVVSFNAITLLQLLDRHGFKVIHLYTCFQPISAGLYGRLFSFGKRALEWIPRLGGTLLVMAKVKN
jgi:2-polyprenyl-3-methyl-5-hydroxy-6-metoxy-1,4-benzoquinol methylase